MFEINLGALGEINALLKTEVACGITRVIWPIVNNVSNECNVPFSGSTSPLGQCDVSENLNLQDHGCKDVRFPKYML